MFRCVAAFAVLVAVLIGCSKPNDATPPGGDPKVEPSDPDAAYELKFAGIQKGDKHEVTKTRSATATIKTPNSTQTQKEEYRYEYTETIVDTAPDEPRPTKVTRVYKTARKTDAKGDTKTASHVGKTITIERYKDSYKYSVEGQSLPPAEQGEIAQDFNLGRWKLDQTLPQKAVKVGEEWQVDFAAITTIAGRVQDVYDKEKSKITGKLVRAYKKDGRQWGVIEVKIVLVFAGQVKGGTESDATYDIVIDGSAQAGTLKITKKGTVERKDVIGNQVITTLEGTEEQSLTPVK
jgi:hypothetical protein